jgi:3-dehydroquinate synthase
MKKITVALDERSYPIYIGENLLGNAELFKKNIDSKQVFIVSNSTIAPLYLEKLTNNFEDNAVESLVLPDGEKHKTLETMNEIITHLLENRLSRNSCLIALGGGVIGDITGFAAACYQRGIDYIQVPTTLLAQVDSSVGGKTAVNHQLGKNMIGAFHQPKAVIADTSVLTTLDDRELSAGLAEVIKYGLIRDKDFFRWLENNIEKLLNRDPEALTYAIECSCKHKAEVVAMDEKETGLRALLNLGHTFGHAIETGMNYQGCLHGEAIAIGMLMAADLSCRLGWLKQESMERIKNILIKAKLPHTIPSGISIQQMQKNMAVDKKAREGVVFLVLLKSIGEAIVTDDYNEESLHATLEQFVEAAEAV